MKIGMITDSLPGTSFEQMLAVAARLSMDALEFGCGPWGNGRERPCRLLSGTEGDAMNLEARGLLR